MNQLVIFLILVLASIPLVLLLSLIDRVKKVESIAQELINSLATRGKNSESKRDQSFLGLDGRDLWQTLSGITTTSSVELTPEEVELLRAKYRPLLEKHVRHLFSAGVKDAKDGKARTSPRPEKTYGTLRGELTVAIPSQQASALYSAGFEAAEASGEGLARVMASVGECLAKIEESVGIAIHSSLVLDLISANKTDPAN
ncbi:MAG: hypothetical protein ACO280_02765 [Pseudohongiellaceae bacterium]